ncbi:hypothetical protein HBB16_00730 [Pseudonocardia sp. MCCB 268]|nr:hypothetical protein [Pseudonocardia cytotoxica]
MYLRTCGIESSSRRRHGLGAAGGAGTYVAGPGRIAPDRRPGPPPRSRGVAVVGRRRRSPARRRRRRPAR